MMAMLDALRLVIQNGLRRVDRHYQRVHALQGVGPVLYVGRARHRGAPLEFPDRTTLAHGDSIGVLHFNNDRFTRIDGRNARRAALEFARLFMESLTALARLCEQDAHFREVQVFHGVSWIASHGSRVGFLSAPYPDGLKKRWMCWHFRLLIWAFAPARQSRLARPDPHHFWLTRQELLQRYAGQEPAAAGCVPTELEHAQERPA